MKKFRLNPVATVLAVVALLSMNLGFSSYAIADTVMPIVKTNTGRPVEATPVVPVDTNGNVITGGGGGGGGSDAVAQNSTTSGQSGVLIQCATTTSAPTYTTAKTNPVSCDTAGSVRVSTGTVTVSDGGGAISVDDNGGSLTVDGSVSVTGSVTVTDGSGAMTVDGTVTVQDGGGSVSVDDNGGSITVDASTAAPLPVVQMPTSSSTYGIVPVPSTSAETGHVLKASAGNLYSLQVTSGASAGYVMLFNSTTVPSAGAVTPVKCYVIAANSSIAVDFRPGPPLYFSTGISWAFSTTGCFTKTDSNTAFGSGEVQ